VIHEHPDLATTREEFAALLASSGLRLERVINAGVLSVIEDTSA
jgi:hypothetical protein